MAHDFAKKRKANTRERGSAQPSTHWTWFFAGFCSATLIAVVVALVVSGKPANIVDTPTTASSGETSAPKTRAEPAPGNKPAFTFYTLLPETEVIIGGEQEPAPQAEDSQSVQPKPDANPTPAVTGLLLQAGSFQSRADADRRRGEIILLGFDAGIQTVDTNNQRWHRVQVGPFASTRALGEAKRTLADIGIDTLELRQKP